MPRRVPHFGQKASPAASACPQLRQKKADALCWAVAGLAVAGAEKGADRRSQVLDDFLLVKHENGYRHGEDGRQRALLVHGLHQEVSSILRAKGMFRATASSVTEKGSGLLASALASAEAPIASDVISASRPGA